MRMIDGFRCREIVRDRRDRLRIRLGEGEWSSEFCLSRHEVIPLRVGVTDHDHELARSIFDDVHLSAFP